MSKPSLLIAGADPELTSFLTSELVTREIDLLWAKDLVAARRLMETSKPRPRAALIDFEQLGVGALDFIAELSNIETPVPVITVIASDDLKLRVEAARRGTRVLLQKPILNSDLGECIDRIFNQETALLARVLVLSHSQEVLQKTTQAIASDRIRVGALQDAVRFWDTLEEQSPNLLVLDVDMPNFSGLDLCRVVRADNRWNWVPVILISSKTDVDTIHNIFAAGADDFIPSDFSPNEISERVWNRLERNYFSKSTFESDMLTGLTTRRQSSNTLNQFLKIAERQRQPFTFSIIDIDHFKLVNDEFGHALGDLVLQRFGKMLSRSLRSEDVIARWGGEEFVIGMYGVGRDAGISRMQRLLDNWREETFFSPAGAEFHTSFSAGVAEFPTDGNGLQQLYRAADEALYAAKITGRNRVRSANAAVEPLPDLPTVALYDLDENSSALLRSCFKQFGILTRAIPHGEMHRLSAETFTGAVLPLNKEFDGLTSTLRDEGSYTASGQMVIYGVYEKLDQLGEFPIMLSGAFLLPLDRPQVIRTIRTTFQLLKKELRRHVRIPLVTKANVEIGGVNTIAVTQELSAGGMSLHLQMPREISGNPGVRVSFTLPGLPELLIEGSVSWARKENRTFGVSFSAMQTALDPLQQWVDDYLDQNLSDSEYRSAKSGK